MRELLASIAAKCPGGKFPVNYLVIDTETSGTDSYTDRILQIGLCFVKDKKKIDAFSQILDYRDVEIHPQAASTHRIDRQRMINEGIPNNLYIPEIVKILKDWRRADHMFVGHNFYSFDSPFIYREVRRCNCDFEFEEDEILDTGAIVKASHLSMSPKADEPLCDFYYRVNTTQSMCKWSLSKYCYERFNLKRSGVNPEQAHSADIDCILTHYLVESFRDILEST